MWFIIFSFMSYISNHWNIVANDCSVGTFVHESKCWSLQVCQSLANSGSQNTLLWLPTWNAEGFLSHVFFPSFMCSIQTKVQMFNLVFFFFDISNMWIPRPCAATSGSCQGQTAGRDMSLIICSQTAVWLNINNIHIKNNSAILIGSC